MSVSSGSARVPVLSISPLESDHDALAVMLLDLPWDLLSKLTLASALEDLRQGAFPIVISERELMPGTWRDVLRQIEELPHPPSLIVTSRVVDQRLWAEALNAGVYEVLFKPFEREEVVPALNSAYHFWQKRGGNQAQTAAPE